MAETRAELLARAVEIRDEFRTNTNTATRVGAALWQIVDSMVLGTFDNPVDPTDDGKLLYASAGAWTKTAAPSAAGQTVVWNGSVWGPGALNLADGDAVTGLLPLANVTGGSAVGQVLRNTAGNVPAWGALDLADTDAVTGILPAANGGTGLGAPANPADDNLMLRASGGAWAKTTAVKTDGSTYLSVGASPAATGNFRGANGLTNGVWLRNAANTQDISAVIVASDNTVRVGDDTNAGGVFLRTSSGNSTRSYIGAVETMRVATASATFPVAGYVLSVGSVPATSGVFRLENNGHITFKGAVVTDVRAIGVNGSDQLIIGSNTLPPSGVLINTATGNTIDLRVNNVVKVLADTSRLNLSSGVVLQFNTTETGGLINTAHNVTIASARNNAGSANVALLKWGATADELHIGTSSVAGMRLDVGGAGSEVVTIGIDGTDEYKFTNIGLNLTNNHITWNYDTASSCFIQQTGDGDATSTSVTRKLGLYGQDKAGTVLTIGGSVEIRHWQ
jgi:hypothetical protein